MNLEFYSPLLKPYVATYGAAIEAAHFSVYPEPCINLDDPNQVADSLADYIRIINRGSNDFMAKFLKPGAVPSEGQFQFSTVSGRIHKTYHPGQENEGWFYLDSNHSIFLGLLNPEEGYTYFAAGSFISGEHGRNAYSCNFPIINQLQGAGLKTFDKDINSYVKYAIAKDIIRRYRWEKALVALVLGWAETEQIHSIYLLPSSRNIWRHKRNEMSDIVERLRMRYDITAERMGFRLVQNGLYGIYLPPAVSET